MRRAASAVALALAAATAGSPVGSGDIPAARIVLEATPVAPGRDASSAPPRFVLLEDDQVFVGGTERLEAGRLEKGEAKELRKRAEQVRKIGGLAGEVAFGGDPALRMRLRLLDDKPVEIVATGDPAQAPPPLAPLASLLADLLRFDHPSLRPWAPPTYAMVVREGRPVGGCRRWGFPFPIAAVLRTPRVVSSDEVAGWPTGGVAASVCGDDAGPSASASTGPSASASTGPSASAGTGPAASAGKRYVVTLRPLLPGEQP